LQSKLENVLICTQGDLYVSHYWQVRFCGTYQYCKAINIWSRDLIDINSKSVALSATKKIGVNSHSLSKTSRAPAIDRLV